MKPCLLKAATLLLALAILAPWAQAQKPGSPLSEQEVADLVQNYVPSERIVGLIQEFDIAFTPSKEYLRNLRKAGADDALIEALKKAKPPEKAKPAEPKKPETTKTTEPPPPPAAPARQRDPLSQEQITKLLANGIPSDTLADLVASLGISFEPTTRRLNDLRVAGAETGLLQAVLRAKRYAPPAPKQAEEKKVAQVTKPPAEPPLKPKEKTEEKKIEKVSTPAPEPQEPVKKEPVVQSPPKPSGPLNVGGEVSPPRPIYTPGAPYTEQARHAHLQGTVILAIVIDQNGQVINLQEISKPLGLGLDDSAIQTVGNWRFKPATFRGMPVQVRVNVKVNFHLQN